MEMISLDQLLQQKIAKNYRQNWRNFASGDNFSAGGQRPAMTDLLNYAPIAAAVFAVPQFLPQIVKLQATGDTAGVSWSWAALTSLNNGAWIAYFALARYWTALIPSSSAALLAGTLAMLLTRRGQARPRQSVLIGTWAAMLIGAYAVAGRTGLGTLLTAAFILQATPSVWTAYRTARPTGAAPGTWLLILGELTCWLIFGLGKSDPRLITLGTTGVIISVLMLARIYRADIPGGGETEPAAAGGHNGARG
jgi:hypothetical protein